MLERNVKPGGIGCDELEWERMKFEGGTMEVDGWLGLLEVVLAMELGLLAG